MLSKHRVWIIHVLWYVVVIFFFCFLFFVCVNKYDRISIYGVYFIMIALYHQIKTLISFWCRRNLNLNLFIQWQKIFLVKLITTQHWFYLFLLHYKVPPIQCIDWVSQNSSSRSHGTQNVDSPLLWRGTGPQGSPFGPQAVGIKLWYLANGKA